MAEAEAHVGQARGEVVIQTGPLGSAFERKPQLLLVDAEHTWQTSIGHLHGTAGAWNIAVNGPGLYALKWA